MSPVGTGALDQLLLPLDVAGAGAGAGSVTGAVPVDPEQAKLVGDRSYLLGRRGTALSDLRPAGVARFGDERVDVVSDGDYVAAGAILHVLRVEGMRVVVRAADPDSTVPPGAGQAPSDRS